MSDTGSDRGGNLSVPPEDRSGANCYAFLLVIASLGPDLFPDMADNVSHTFISWDHVEQYRSAFTIELDPTQPLSWTEIIGGPPFGYGFGFNQGESEYQYTIATLNLSAPPIDYSINVWVISTGGHRLTFCESTFMEFVQSSLQRNNVIHDVIRELEDEFEGPPGPRTESPSISSSSVPMSDA